MSVPHAFLSQCPHNLVYMVYRAVLSSWPALARSVASTHFLQSGSCPNFLSFPRTHAPTHPSPPLCQVSGYTVNTLGLTTNAVFPANT